MTFALRDTGETNVKSSRCPRTWQCLSVPSPARLLRYPLSQPQRQKPPQRVQRATAWWRQRQKPRRARIGTTALKKEPSVNAGISRTQRRRRPKWPSSAPAPTADPAPPRPAQSAIQPSVANARAELAPRPPKAENASDDATLSETIWPEPQPRTDAVTSNNDQGPNTQPENTGTASPTTGTITSRWPDASLPSTDNNQSTADGETRPQQSAALQAAPVKDDKSAASVAAGQFNGISFNSTPMLLIMFAGVLTIVAIIGRMIVKYAGHQRAKTRNQRRDIWAAVPQEGDASQAYEALLQPRSSQFARVPTEANDPSDEIEKLLQRASKRAAA